MSTTLKKMRHTAYGLGLIVEGWVRIEFLCLQARIKPWAVWEDRTGEDDEAWVGLCVCVWSFRLANFCAGHEAIGGVGPGSR